MAAQPAPQRKKLLVLNVFFAPQSIGGATRVAQDQVQASATTWRSVGDHRALHAG